MNFCKTSMLTVWNLELGFGAKTIDFDVKMIRNMSFQALTKNF